MNRRSFLITAAATVTTLNLTRSAPGQAVGSIQEPASLTIQKAAELIRSRQLSPTDLTRACLERIERYNPTSLLRWRPRSMLTTDPCSSGLVGATSRLPEKGSVP